MKEVELKVVSRFRDDARLQYILTPIKQAKRDALKPMEGKEIKSI